MKNFMKTMTLTAALAALASPVLAHTGAGAAHGFGHGFAHPFGGLDHLLVMLAVGIWAALVLPKRTWLAPLGFVAAMLAGAMLAWQGVALPSLELGIATSVAVAGAMVALRVTPGVLAAVLIAGFALLHGQAHGLEASGAMLPYMAGFSIATAMLHLAGVAVGRAIIHQRFATSATGSAIAAAGLVLLVL